MNNSGNIRISIPFGSCTESVEYDVGDDVCYVVGTYPNPKEKHLDDIFYYANMSFRDFIDKYKGKGHIMLKG